MNSSESTVLDVRRGSRRLFKASAGSLLGVIGAIALCETPLLAAMLVGVGASSSIGRVSGWVDAGGVVLAFAAFSFASVGFYRSYRALKLRIRQETRPSLARPPA